MELCFQDNGVSVTSRHLTTHYLDYNVHQPNDCCTVVILSFPNCFEYRIYSFFLVLALHHMMIDVMTTPRAPKRTRAAPGISSGARDTMIRSLPGEHIVSYHVLLKIRQCNVAFVVCGAHVKCESLPEDVYENLNKVFDVVPNISYYCEANHCNSHVKQLIHHHYNSL